MRKELEHFNIGEAIGGSQEWFLDPFMKLGGCGAVTACDTCIWLARKFEGEDGGPDARWLYPFDPANPTRTDFLHFGRVMKPYLRPRSGGISRLELYMRGFSAYLRGRSEAWKQEACDRSGTPLQMLRMEGLAGNCPADEAWAAVVRQIDEDFPVPTLVLRHKDPELKDYVWHWFLLAGYSDEREDGEQQNDEGKGVRKVKTVTYGEAAWVDFDRLWDTGHDQKGGLVLYRWET